MTSDMLPELLAGERVDDREPIDGVAEHLDAQHRLLVGRMDLDGVAPHPELAPPERQVVAVVLEIDELAQDRPLVVVDPGVQLDQVAPVLLGVAHAVDAADRGHHDGVAPGEQRGGGRVAEPIDLVVDRRVLLDVGVARGDVGLGLVVVVVADEVLDPVVRGRTPASPGPAGRRGSCWGRGSGSAAAPARWSRRWWRSCPNR